MTKKKLKGKPRKESPQMRERKAELRKKGFVSPMEASANTATPLQTIYTWIREERVLHVRIGARRIFVNLNDLKRLTAPVMVAPTQ